MREFLQASCYCDTGHPLIHRALVTTTGDVVDEVGIAVRLFRFVRDQVLYTFGPWGVPASTTLERREGVCTNKSNLLVALLRAAAIPAAYGILRVNPREYFGSIAHPSLKPLISDRSVHIYTAAFLRGRWIRCDPSTDSELSAKTAHFCRQTRLIDWDGHQDALDFLQPQHVHGDLGLRPAIDDRLVKAPRHANPGTIATLNGYVNFIRRHPRFKTADALLAAYSRRLEDQRRNLQS